MLDAKAFGAELAEMVRGCLSPMLDRLAALEKRMDERPVDDEARAAVSAVRDDVAVLRDAFMALPVAPELPDIPAMVSASVEAALKSIPVPEAPALPDVAGMVREAVGEAVKAIPAPEMPDVAAMVDVAVRAIPVPEAPVLPDVDGMVREAVAEAVKAIPVPKDGTDGRDGESVLVGDVLPTLQKHVDEYLDAVPLPKDGTSVTADDVLPAVIKRADEYLATVKPADGVGLADALIDRDGNLVLTMTDGRAKHLGPVIGKDAEPGKPGIDGVGFDDMTLDYDGERGFTFLFQKGGRIEERHFVVPVILDRGVYRPEGAYQKGDAVSYSGSLWIAQTDTKARPDNSPDWRLSVKAGRNGRDAALRPPPDTGPLKVGGGNAG